MVSHRTSFDLGHLLPTACFLPFGPHFYLCLWPAATPHTQHREKEREKKQKICSHTITQEVFIMVKLHHKCLMCEVWHRNICRKVIKLEGHANQIFRLVGRVGFGCTCGRQKKRVKVHISTAEPSRDICTNVGLLSVYL